MHYVWQLGNRDLKTLCCSVNFAVAAFSASIKHDTTCSITFPLHYFTNICINTLVNGSSRKTNFRFHPCAPCPCKLVKYINLFDINIYFSSAILTIKMCNLYYLVRNVYILLSANVCPMLPNYHTSSAKSSMRPGKGKRRHLTSLLRIEKSNRQKQFKKESVTSIGALMQGWNHARGFQSSFWSSKSCIWSHKNIG